MGLSSRHCPQLARISSSALELLAHARGGLAVQDRSRLAAVLPWGEDGWRVTVSLAGVEFVGAAALERARDGRR
jgi:hypothetical protein